MDVHGPARVSTTIQGKSPGNWVITRCSTEEILNALIVKASQIEDQRGHAELQHVQLPGAAVHGMNISRT